MIEGMTESVRPVSPNLSVGMDIREKSETKEGSIMPREWSK